jgi:predicted nucleic acid-binding protein
MKILDSSPVIAFYTELNEPDMLHKFIELGYELRIPESVFKEIENGRTSDTLKSNIANGNIEIIASLPEKEILHFKNRYPYLGNGEIEVILLWLKLESSIDKNYCIIDDKKARKVAEKHNVVFTGTIGLINMLLKKQAINKDKREKLINKLSSSRFRMNKSF